jgi:predicted amidohydrolase
MQKGFRIFCVTLAIVLAVYFTWANAGRKTPDKSIELHIDSTYSLYTDQGMGNIVGISPYMTPIDYASEEHFFGKLDAYLQSALQKGWIKDKTVILFPEYIASWLVVENEKNSIYNAATTGKAMGTFVASNFFSYLRSWFTAPDGIEDKIKYSVFTSKGGRVAKIYVNVFSTLAKKYKVTIVAGSVLLPNPEVNKNKISVNKGPLYNITGVFNPDGSLQSPLVKKSFPVADELPFIAKCPPAEIPVFDLPVGKTAVMICADAWYPEAYSAVNKNQPKLILVPSYTPQDNAMRQLWSGYSGFKKPEDADSTDIGKLTLGQAWNKYTLPGRISTTSATAGLAVSLRGKMWDMGSDGEFIAVQRDTVTNGHPVKGASMICLWLN